MKPAKHNIFGISKQRGIWLRCFLDAGFLPFILFALALQAMNAQITVLKPLHLSHLYGYVLSETGKPLAGVKVALASGKQPSQAGNTDANGFFDFPDARGEYLFHVKLPGAALVDRLIIVGAGSHARLHRGPIYVMIKPGGACSDCTSPIFLSKGDFDRAVQENTGNHD